MNPIVQIGVRIFFIGIVATLVLDIWILMLKGLGLPSMNFAQLGRWAGHVARGRWFHERIANAAPIAGELWIGWMVHYVTGIAFAAVLVSLCGLEWLRSPSLLPPLALGMATVAVPLLILQPAMGAGIASSKTPTPIRNCLKSLANHTIFGAGLYCGCLVMAAFN